MAIAYRLSAIHYRFRRQELSLELAEEGLRLARELFPPAHPAEAEGLSRTGFALAALGDCAEGLVRQRRALEIVDSFYGPRHFGIVRYREDLATMLSACGDPAAAADVSLEVVDLLTERYGVGHEQTLAAEAKAEGYAELARMR